MKKKEEQLISRGIDGELDEAEREALEKILNEDPEARALSGSWDALGERLRDAKPAEAPDAYRAWQDIRREIRQTERDDEERFRHGARLRWAGAFAGVLVLGLMALSAVRLYRGTATDYAFGDPVDTRVDWVEAGIPGATTVIYTDVETDMTVIWMDVAQTGDSRDT